VHGPRERTRVEHRLVRKTQHGRQALARVLHEGVAALAERVPEEHPPLGEVHRVTAPTYPGIPGSRRLREESGHVLREGLLHALGESLLRELDACVEYPGDFGREIVAAGQVGRRATGHDVPRFPLARYRADLAGELGPRGAPRFLPATGSVRRRGAAAYWSLVPFAQGRSPPYPLGHSVEIVPVSREM